MCSASSFDSSIIYLGCPRTFFLLPPSALGGSCMTCSFHYPPHWFIFIIYFSVRKLFKYFFSYGSNGYEAFPIWVSAGSLLAWFLSSDHWVLLTGAWNSVFVGFSNSVCSASSFDSSIIYLGCSRTFFQLPSSALGGSCMTCSFHFPPHWSILLHLFFCPQIVQVFIFILFKTVWSISNLSKCWKHTGRFSIFWSLSTVSRYCWPFWRALSLGCVSCRSRNFHSQQWPCCQPDGNVFCKYLASQWFNKWKRCDLSPWSVPNFSSNCNSLSFFFFCERFHEPSAD